MKSGRHNDYFWIEWDSAFLWPLLQGVPEIVLGRFLVNTSFDSGSLALSDDERRQGWHSAGALTCSPRISSLAAMPRGAGYDEWLVFSEPAKIHTWKPFVNYAGMSLNDPEWAFLQDELWAQMDSVRPESYLAEGDRLLFATRTRHLHELALTLSQ